MLTPAQVVPFLADPRDLVRSHAQRYLTGAANPAPATDDDLWRACDLLENKLDHYSTLFALNKIAPSDTATLRLLETIGQTDDEYLRLTLLLDLENLDIHQFLRHQVRILTCPHLSEFLRSGFQVRIDSTKCELPVLWDRLIELSRTMDERGLSLPQIAQRDGLLDGLELHGSVFAPMATEFIARPKANMAETWCVEILGRLRHRPALDHAVNLLRNVEENEDYLHDACETAIPRIGGEDAVGPLVDLIRTAPWHVKITATAALGHLRFPQAEAALADMLRSGEADKLDIGNFLASELSNLCPTGEAFEALWQWTHRGTYDKTEIDARSACVIVAEMTGQTFPQYKNYLAHFEDMEKKDTAIIRAFNTPSEAALQNLRDMVNGVETEESNEDAFDEGEDDADSFWPDPYESDEPPAGRLLPDTISAYLPPVNGTIRRETPKAGRNDPCPCGSGKKYKKCCWDKDNR